MIRNVLTVACLHCFAALLHTDNTVDYLRDVKPVLKQRCYSCHGALKQEAGLRLDTAELMRRGNDGGPVVEPGDAEGSLLLAMVTGEFGTRMPPEGEPLSEKEIELLKGWIAQGAEGPADEKPEPEPRDHWAFRVPVRPTVPQISESGWVRNPLDALIAAEHREHGLVPSPPAEKHVLLRRVYLDLIGLPPTRQQLHAFLEDTTSDAYEKVVDRLLASPQYGERWGRHWMDVWRYSDWYGRRGQNDVRNSYPHIWRWRDWIVRSLNEDKGYDRMVMEMLAADEIAPAEDDAVVATGFIARNWYKLNYNIWMKDLVEHTGKAFLGLTLNCALCHDHKYDPISQKEYFQFRAFFEPLELRQDRVPGLPDPGPFQKYIYGSSLKPLEAGLVRVFDERPDAETYMIVLGDERNRREGVPPVSPGAPAAFGGDRLAIEPVDLPPHAYYPGLKPWIQQAQLAEHEASVAVAVSGLAEAKRGLSDAIVQLAAANAAQHPGDDTDESLAISDATKTALAQLDKAESIFRGAEARRATGDARLKSLRARIAADNAKYNEAPGDVTELSTLASTAERQAAWREAQETLVKAERSLVKAKQKAAADAKEGGAVENADKRVKEARDALATAKKAVEAVGSEYTPLGPVYPARSTGRRTALARWITSRKNPLTARVAVNHIWMRHFGSPLVETVFDFGRNGKAPSHPELLDWLAVEFMEGGWNMKALHRLMVTSNTYRMQSKAGDNSESTAPAGPDNRYYWRMNPRRMEAEVVRDSVLFAAGQLDQTLGGPEVDQTQGQDSNRRSMYFSHHLETRVKLLEIFDAANPAECYRRTETVVPQQALAMTNSRFLSNESRLLARRLWQNLDTPQAVTAESSFVVATFEQVISRAPSDEEQSTCEAFLAKQRELYLASDLKARATEGTDGWVPPAADPAMRARESLVRALFNHNDFVTIR